MSTDLKTYRECGGSELADDDMRSILLKMPPKDMSQSIMWQFAQYEDYQTLFDDMQTQALFVSDHSASRARPLHAVDEEPPDEQAEDAQAIEHVLSLADGDPDFIAAINAFRKKFNKGGKGKGKGNG